MPSTICYVFIYR